MADDGGPVRSGRDMRSPYRGRKRTRSLHLESDRTQERCASGRVVPAGEAILQRIVATTPLVEYHGLSREALGQNRGSGEDGMGTPSPAPIRVDAGRRRARQRRPVRRDREARSAARDDLWDRCNSPPAQRMTMAGITKARSSSSYLRCHARWRGPGASLPNHELVVSSARRLHGCSDDRCRAHGRRIVSAWRADAARARRRGPGPRSSRCHGAGPRGPVPIPMTRRRFIKQVITTKRCPPGSGRQVSASWSSSLLKKGSPRPPTS